MIESKNFAFKDVTQYQNKYLQIDADKIHIPVTYKKSWDDGFGARGWKVNVTIGDPQIIASTRETGPKINTSVFVHDILDHFLSGFDVSGHRSEAMALIQLAKRTGSSPEPDYKQIIEEDILNGRINGESMQSFLPLHLLNLLPNDTNLSDRDIILFLKKELGDKTLSDELLKHFFELGHSGKQHAMESWKILGLDIHKQKEIGLALQKLLIGIDNEAEKTNMEKVEGIISIDKHMVSFKEMHGKLFMSSIVD
ncbi:MAG: hypothetical protein OQL19_21045 [Gammaproteobacteria bacterium]|nr:hypothetical protein [Gammaproteobacteria bacterium]